MREGGGQLAGLNDRLVSIALALRWQRRGNTAEIFDFVSRQPGQTPVPDAAYSVRQLN